MVAFALLLVWYGLVSGESPLLLFGVLLIWLLSRRYGSRILLWLVLVIFLVVARGRHLYLRQFKISDECKVSLYSTTTFELGVAGNQVVHIDKHLVSNKQNELGSSALCRLYRYTLGGMFTITEQSRLIVVDAIIERFKLFGAARQGKLYVAMFLGARQSIDQYFLEQATKAGVVHVLVVSGYNVALFVAFIDRVLQRAPVYYRRVLRLFMLALWFFIVGVDPPILRVFISGVISIFAEVIGYSFNKGFKWLLLILGLVYLDPFLIMSLSMQLTLLATWAVTFGLEYAESLIVSLWKITIGYIMRSNWWWGKYRLKHKPPCSRIVRLALIFMQDYLLITLIVNLVLLPVFWVNKIKGVTNIGDVLLHNLLLLPVLDVLVPIGYAGLPLLFIGGDLGGIFVALVDILYYYVRWVVFY